MSFIRVFLIVLASLFPFAAVASGGYNSATHDLYTDGSRYWLKAKPAIVIIAADVNTPIQLDPWYSDILLAPQGDGSWSISYAPTATQLQTASGVSWVPATNIVYYYDYDSDGSQDIFIRAKTSSQKSLMVFSQTGTDPTLLAINASVGGVDTSSASGYKLTFNGRTIVATKTGHLTMTASISSSGISSFSAKGSTYEIADEATAPKDTLLDDTYVGEQSYEAAATQSGTLSVNFPVYMPEGVGGLKPQVAINYNSHGGNGLLGVGFNLSGAGSIQRCAKIVETERVSSLPAYTDNDAICYNGQKLILTSGTKLQDGAEYRTEIDTYNKVSLSRSGSSFVFTVYKKDGRIETYAKAIKSKGVLAGVEKQWLLSEVKDRFENKITYSYITGNYGDTYLSKITYSDVTISFLYNDSVRNDSVVKFSNGDEYRMAKYLTDIKVGQGSSAAVFREYHYLYNTTGDGRYSQFNEGLQLDAMQECGYTTAGNGSTRACKPALTFEWTDQGFNLVDSSTSISTLENRQQTVAVDWDGSGTTDLLVVNDSEIAIHYSGSDGQLQSTETLYSIPSGKKIAAVTPIDLDLNGYPELIFRLHDGPYQASTKNLQWYLMQHDGSVSELGSLVTYGNKNKYPLIADINQDGYPDVILPSGQATWTLATNNSASSSSASLAVSSTQIIGTGESTKGITLLGQVAGKTYLLNEKTDALDLLVITADGTISSLETGIANDKYIPLDANGDGLRDILVGTDGNLILYLNSGIGFKQVSTSVASNLLFTSVSDKLTYRDYPVRVQDFNGDGLDDLSYVENNQIKFLISTGADFYNENFGGIFFSGIGGAAASALEQAIGLPAVCFSNIDYLKVSLGNGFSYDPNSSALVGWDNASNSASYFVDGDDAVTSNIYQAAVVLSGVYSYAQSTLYNSSYPLYVDLGYIFDLDSNGNIQYDNDGSPLTTGNSPTSAQLAAFLNFTSEQQVELGSNIIVYYRVMRSVLDAINSCQSLVFGTTDEFSSAMNDRLSLLNAQVSDIKSYLNVSTAPERRIVASDASNAVKQIRYYSYYMSPGILVFDFSSYFLGNAMWGLDSTKIADAVSTSGSAFDYQFADTNGDGRLDLIKQLVQGSNQWTVALNQQDSHARLASITNARDKKTSFTYSDVSNPDIYATEIVTKIPKIGGRITIHGGYPLLASISTTDSREGQPVRSEKAYHYRDIRLDLLGLGLLGASEVTTIDTVLNRRKVTTYNQTFPYIGLASTSTTFVGDSDIKITDIQYYWKSSTAGGVYQVEPDYDETFDYDFSSEQLYRKARTDYAFDSYGNLLNKKQSIYDPYLYNLLTNQYQYSATYPMDGTYNDESQWLISFASSTTETWHRAGTSYDVSLRSLSDRTLVHSYSRYADTLKVYDETITTPAGELTTSYGYDSYGNTTSKTVSSTADGSIQNVYSQYQANKWPTKQYNTQYGSSVIASTLYDSRYGGILGTTDFAGISNASTFDAFGRAQTSTDQFGQTAKTTYQWCSLVTAACATTDGTIASYSVTTEKPGTPTVVTYYDSFANKVKMVTAGFTSTQSVVQEWQYDAAGRVVAESLPSDNGSLLFNTTSYDELGRVAQKNMADGGSVSMTYGAAQGRRYNATTQTIVSAGLTKSYTRSDSISVNDKIVKSTQALGTADAVTTLYDYDPQGNLDWSKVLDGIDNIDLSGVKVIAHFDVMGNRIQLNDPDIGVVTDVYTPMGYLASSTNNSGQTVSFSYDKLGRMTSRTENEGTTSWYYDTDSNCTLDDADASVHVLPGYLCAVKNPTQKYAEQYGYNNLGQRIYTREDLQDYNFGAAGTQNKNYLVGYTYDQYGRLDNTLYDSGLMVARDYTDTGYLKKTYNADQTSTVYYQVDELNAFRTVSQFTLGNGIQVVQNIDGNSGRLAGITATNSSGTELVRESYQWYSNGALYTKGRGRSGINSSETYAYDDINRLVTVTRGTNTLTYNYDVLGNLTQKPNISGSLAYNQTDNAGPHAVTAAGGLVYKYDTRGNMIQRGSDTIVYTSYDKPYSISSAAGTETFLYGPDRNRYRHQSPNSITYYQAGAGYEEIYNTGDAEPIKRHYLDGGLVLDIKGAATTLKYQIKDYKDSLLAVTDASGAVLQYSNFDPYGERTEGDISIVTRGFTDHEHLDSGLIHMNGRVYDPVVGRFLSADIMVQAPYNSQSYNRYSYVMNNPVSFVDPSGYAWWPIEKIQLGYAYLKDAIAGWITGQDVTFYFDEAKSDLAYSDQWKGSSDNLIGLAEGLGTSAVSLALAPQGGHPGIEGGVQELLSPTNADQAIGFKEGTDDFVAVAAGVGLAVGARGFPLGRSIANKEFVPKSVRYGPTNPGPLDAATAATFRSGSYTATTTSETTTLYRVYGGNAGKIGSYWTRTKPSGPLQSQLDSALAPQWGNTAQNVATMKVPKGTTIYEGAAAPQSTGVGQILGGGNQVYIPRVNPNWIQ